LIVGLALMRMTRLDLQANFAIYMLDNVSVRLGCLPLHPDQHAGLSRCAARKEQSGLEHDQPVP
jgi:hypothetical protein